MSKYQNIKSAIRYIRIEEWITILLFIIITSINYLFFDGISPGRSLELMFQYFAFGNPFYLYFIIFLLFYSLYILSRDLYRFLKKYFINYKNFPKNSSKLIFKNTINYLRILIPLNFAALPFFHLLSNLSYSLRFSGKDFLLFYSDKIIFGKTPFIHWPSEMSSFFFENAMQIAYFSLSITLSLTLIITFSLGKMELARRQVLTFIISLVIMFPIFYAIPCQDPNNFFIRDLRNQQLPSDIQSELENYNPSPFIASKISAIAGAETNVEKDNSVPISCFPSAHAVWAFLAVYFLAKIRRWTLFISIPWVTLLLIGGVYLAQHYVIDYIVAIPFLLASIWIAKYLIDKDPNKRYK